MPAARCQGSTTLTQANPNPAPNQAAMMHVAMRRDGSRLRTHIHLPLDAKVLLTYLPLTTTNYYLLLTTHYFHLPLDAKVLLTTYYVHLITTYHFTNDNYVCRSAPRRALTLPVLYPYP